MVAGDSYNVTCNITNFSPHNLTVLPSVELIDEGLTATFYGVLRNGILDRSINVSANTTV